MQTQSRSSKTSFRPATKWVRSSGDSRKIESGDWRPNKNTNKWGTAKMLYWAAPSAKIAEFRPSERKTTMNITLPSTRNLHLAVITNWAKIGTTSPLWTSINTNPTTRTKLVRLGLSYTSLKSMFMNPSLPPLTSHQAVDAKPLKV